MGNTRWNPFQDLLFLQERVSRAFDEALLRFRGTEGFSNSAWSPPVDVYETDHSIVFKAEVPGMDIDNVDVEIHGRTLTLKGERRFEKNLNEEHYHRMERPYGIFQRVFTLPDHIDRKGVKASLKDGVLKVTVPKTEKPKEPPVKITID